MVLKFLQNDEPFPHPSQATPDGIVAYGGGLSPKRLLDAYTQGIFPWYNPNDPILWWSPNPRCVLYPQDFKLRKSFEKRLRNSGFEIRFDYDFQATIRACREVNGRAIQGTWILPEIINAYTQLHHMGYAHSVETYLDGKLVGGLYGVSLGNAFFGESMFSYERDASKVALYALNEFAHAHNFAFIDCQIPTQHLLSMGAVCVPRVTFLTQLQEVMTHPTIKGTWAPL